MSVAVRTPTSLEQLAATINHEHGLVLEAGTTMIQHAARAGEALNQAKQLVPWGEWRAWLGDNFDLSYGSALIYMRIAKHQELVADQPSVAAARRFLLEELPNEVRGQGRRPPRPAYLPDALAMKGEGMTYAQIADVVGLTPHAIRWQLRPQHLRDKAIKRTQERNVERAAEARAARTAAARAERDAAMRRAGGDAWDAYCLIRKAAVILDRMGLASEYHQLVRVEDGIYERARAV